MFSLLRGDNAGWGTVEGTGVHSHSTQAETGPAGPIGLPLSGPCYSSVGTTPRESVQSLQLHFKEVGAGLQRERL